MYPPAYYPPPEPFYGPPVKQKKPKHPALPMFQGAAACMLLAWILSFACIFVAWSWKNLGGNNRASLNLWQVCSWDASDRLDAYACQNVEQDVNTYPGNPPYYGSEKCRGFLMATNAFTFLGFFFSLFALIALALVIMKIWKKAKPFALCALCLAFFAFWFLLIAWIMFIIFAEENCGGVRTWRGYSYGFVLMVLASFFALCSLLLACLGFMKLKKFLKPKYPTYNTPPPPPYYPGAPPPPFMAPSPYMPQY